jgi:hypothetical protein
MSGSAASSRVTLFRASGSSSTMIVLIFPAVILAALLRAVNGKGLGQHFRPKSPPFDTRKMPSHHFSIRFAGFFRR